MTYQPNIAYVTYGSVGMASALNPYWQQLSQWGASYSVAGDTLSVSLTGGSGNEWGGVVSEQTQAWAFDSSLAVQVTPGGAASSANAMWAGIQLTTALPQNALSGGDPTNPACYPLVRLAVDQGNLWFGEITGSGTTVWGTATYDPVNHKYIRMYADSFGFHAHYSPDGITWTPAFSGGASPGPYFPELAVYSTGSITSTASFSDFVFASGNPPNMGPNTVAVGSQIPMSVVGSTRAALSVAASAIVVSSANEIVAVTGNGLPEIAVPFNYGDSAELINAYATDAVRAAAGDFSLQVVFLG